MRFASCLTFALAVAVSGCGSDDPPTAPSPNVAFSTIDLRVGTGAEATSGRNVTVNYALFHYSSTAADNKAAAIESGTFPFVVGSSQVIPGFSQATQGMRVGGLRRAIVPPNLAYGAAGNPPKIPGNAVLVFEIELVSVQ